MRILCLLAAVLVASAAETDAAAARAAFLRGLAGAPAVQAAQERVAASRLAGAAAGRLPDPMLAAGYARKSTAMDRWPMYDLALEQPLPRWGERDAQRARAAAETALGEAELLDVLGDIAAETAMALAAADAARARLALVDGQIARAHALAAAVAARIAAGTASAAEQLGVRSRLAALAVERDTVARLAADAEQDVRGRLGLADTAPLPPFAAPERAGLALDRLPGVAAARARAAEAEAAFQEARAGRYPETAVGLRYEREAQPGERMDTVGLELRLSLPAWQGAARDLEQAALARRRAARSEAAGWEQRARAMLGRAERAAAVAATARTAAEADGGRIDAEYDALVRAAAGGNAIGLAAVLDALDRLSAARAAVIEADAAAREADAGLWRLAPPDPAALTGTSP